jgi:hypothetical protein
MLESNIFVAPRLFNNIPHFVIVTYLFTQNSFHLMPSSEKDRFNKNQREKRAKDKPSKSGNADGAHHQSISHFGANTQNANMGISAQNSPQ